ncbi:helix-turn-helix domain-containing protein, partial [Streptomyces sp. NPDC055140]
LDRETARRWAAATLHGILSAAPRERDELLALLGPALEYSRDDASEILGRSHHAISRRTITTRLDKAFKMVGLNRQRALDRVLVSLALQVVQTLGYDDRSADPAADFTRLLQGPAMRSYGQDLVKQLASTRLKVLPTVEAWLEHNCNTEDAAAALGLSAKTIRAHLHEAEPLIGQEMVFTGLGMDVSPSQEGNLRNVRLGAVRPLSLSLYAATGRPVFYETPAGSAGQASHAATSGGDSEQEPDLP